MKTAQHVPNQMPVAADQLSQKIYKHTSQKVDMHICLPYSCHTA